MLLLLEGGWGVSGCVGSEKVHVRLMFLVLVQIVNIGLTGN